MKFKNFIYEAKQYKFTGAERDLFDVGKSPKFRIGDRVKGHWGEGTVIDITNKYDFNKKYYGSEKEQQKKDLGYSVKFDAFPYENTEYVLRHNTYFDKEKFEKSSNTIKKINEEYKFKGIEKNLFDRIEEPKYKIGDRVSVSKGRGIIDSIISYNDWLEKYYPEDPKLSFNRWLYVIKFDDERVNHDPIEHHNAYSDEVLT